MARSDIQVNVRLPETLKRQLEQAAVLSRRSVTAEIVYRLEASFPENVVAELKAQRDAELALVQSRIDHLEDLIEQFEREGYVTGASQLRKHKALLVNVRACIVEGKARLSAATGD